MGELPPLHTPQGPGVPRAFRPGFPRVDSSGTSSAPSSRSASFPFLASSSLHVPIQLPPRISPPLSTRVSLRFLPVPSPSLRPVPVGLSTSFLTPLPGSFSSPFHAYLLGIVLCLGFGFPRCRFGFAFPQLPPPFPPASFPFLPLPFVQFSPVLSTLVLFGSPVVFPPTRRSDFLPFSFRIPGSAAPLSGLGFCGPRVAPKRPHTTPQERQRQQGRFGHLNLPSKPRSPLETEVWKC